MCEDETQTLLSISYSVDLTKKNLTVIKSTQSKFDLEPLEKHSKKTIEIQHSVSYENFSIEEQTNPLKTSTNNELLNQMFICLLYCEFDTHIFSNNIIVLF